MIRIRPESTRGRVEHAWLDSRHSFSFGGWHDPAYMGVGPLRVLNEDRIVGGSGFPAHSHQDMEILTYVLSGRLRHRDSTGGESILPPGEMQVMTAGRGIAHSEMNASAVEPAHFLQIWIIPDRRGLEPGYQQRPLDPGLLRAGFATIAAPAGEGALFRLHQDARLAIAWPAAGQALEMPLARERRHYLQVARGAVRLAGESLQAGDAATLSDEARLALTATADSELLLFDLPS